MSHHPNNNQDDNNDDDDHYYHHPNPSSPFSSLSPSSTQMNTTSLFSKDNNNNNNHYHIQQQQQPYLSSSSSSSLPIVQLPVHSFNPYNEDDLNYYHHHQHSGTNVPTSSSQVPPPPIPYHLLLSKQQQQQQSTVLQGEEDSFVLQSSSSSHVPLDQQQQQQQQQPYHHYNPTTTTTIEYNNDMNDMEAITTTTNTTTNTNDEEDQLLMMEQYEEHLLSGDSSSSSYLTYFEQNKITKHSLFLIQLYKGFMYTMHTLQSLLHIQFNRHSSSSSSSSFSLSSLNNNNNKSVMSIKKLVLFWLIHSLFIGATLLFVLGMGVLCGYLTVQYGIWSRPLGAQAKEWHRFLLVLPYNYIMLWVLTVMVACTLYMMILFLVVYLPCKMILDYSFKFYVRVVHNQLKNEIRDQMNRLNHDLTMDAQELQSPVQSSSPVAPNRTPQQRKQEQQQQHHHHHSKDLQSMLTGHMKSFVKQNFSSVMMDNVNMGMSDNNNNNSNQSMLNNEQLTWQFIWNDFVHYCKFYVRNKLKRNLRRIAIRFLMSVLFTNGIGALFALLIPGFGIVVSLCCFLFSTGLNTALIGLDVIFDEKSYNIWEQQRTVWNHLWLIVGMGLAQSLIGCVPIVGLFLMYPICTITSTRFLYHLEYWGQSGKCDEFWNLPLIESCVPYCVAFYLTPHSRRHTNGSWFRIAHQSKRQEMSLSYADHHLSEDDSGDGIDHALDNIIQMLLVQQPQQ